MIGLFYNSGLPGWLPIVSVAVFIFAGTFLVELRRQSSHAVMCLEYCQLQVSFRYSLLMVFLTPVFFDRTRLCHSVDPKTVQPAGHANYQSCVCHTFYRYGGHF